MIISVGQVPEYNVIAELLKAAYQRDHSLVWTRHVGKNYSCKNSFAGLHEEAVEKPEGTHFHGFIGKSDDDVIWVTIKCENPVAFKPTVARDLKFPARISTELHPQRNVSAAETMALMTKSIRQQTCWLW